VVQALVSTHEPGVVFTFCPPTVDSTYICLRAWGEGGDLRAIPSFSIGRCFYTFLAANWRHDPFFFLCYFLITLFPGLCPFALSFCGIYYGRHVSSRVTRLVGLVNTSSLNLMVILQFNPGCWENFSSEGPPSPAPSRPPRTPKNPPGLSPHTDTRNNVGFFCLTTLSPFQVLPFEPNHRLVPSGFTFSPSSFCCVIWFPHQTP